MKPKPLIFPPFRVFLEYRFYVRLTGHQHERPCAHSISDGVAFFLRRRLVEHGRLPRRHAQIDIARNRVALALPEFQPQRRSRSWELSVREHRARVEDDLKDSPGLKGRLSEAVERAYRYGRVQALQETKLPDDVIPVTCPYSYDELMTRPIVYEPPLKHRKR